VFATQLLTKVRDNPKDAIELFNRSVEEMEEGKFEDTIGMVDNDTTATELMKLDRFNLIEDN